MTSDYYVGYNSGMSKNPKSSGSSQVTENPPFIIVHKALSISLIALIIFIVSGVMWWRQVYNNPRRVFETMLSNNLSTQGVTRSSKSVSEGTPIDKTEQISFVPKIASRTLVIIDQKAPDGASTSITSETIGTLSQDYSRYIKINTSQKNAEGKPLDYSKVINIWGKSDSLQGEPQNFSQATLGLIPFANLNESTKNKVLEVMNKTNAYEVDYSKVEPKVVGNKAALVFPVKVNTAGYVEALKIVAKATGLGDTPGLDPKSYKDQPPIEIKIIIDKHSRHILEVDYGQDQKEQYSAYGLSLPIELPNKTIPINELQQKVQDIK